MRRAYVGWIVAAAAGSLFFVPMVACEDASVGTLGTIEAGQLDAPTAEATTGTGGQDGDTPSDAAVEATADAAVDASAGDAGVDASAVDAAGDAAVVAKCGNGVLEPGETCDPITACPTSCPSSRCQLRTLVDPGTCTAKCVDTIVQTTCANGDGCCPAGGICNATNDDDCTSTCDNGVLEGSEKCDPLASCPASCPALGCQLRALSNGGTCAAECVNTTLQTACVSGDSCCPPGCNSVNDTDCGVGCGNNVVEAGETCDPLTSCPTVCPPVGIAPNRCQFQKLQNAGTCSAKCVNSSVQTACINNDECCPPGCDANTDNDCAVACDNGKIEPGETCDPLASCPTTCPQQGCQLFQLDKGGTCQATCSPSAIQSACVNGDGCCPKGCDNTNDSDCAPFCGNGVVESGETCDPGTTCPRCVPPTLGCFANQGSPATCDVACNVPITKCGGKDSCCPYGCGDLGDGDCAAPKWDYVQLADVDFTAGCVTVVVAGIEGGASYDVTTCVPKGGTPGTGNPGITQVLDPRLQVLAPANDNCTEKSALPQLAGWDCTNKLGATVAACATPDSGGFMAPGGTTAFKFDVCPSIKGGGGIAPIYIWYNAATTKPVATKVVF